MILETRALRKSFNVDGRTLNAVRGVDLAIARGETFGLVGESGCGKSTLGRTIMGIHPPTSGEVIFEDAPVPTIGRARRAFTRRMQMVFQDPYSSLNPRLRAGAIVEEPLIVQHAGSAAARAARVEELFGLVGLDPAWRSRYPHEFSGGQRQRIGVARALALNPTFVIADEPVSALDVSVQAQIVNLLMDLQDRLKLTYLFIAHDLRLVEHICNRVAVMYRGRIVELAAARDLFTSPRHAYTQALLSAVPVPDPSSRRVRVPLDQSKIDRTAPLREIAAGHWAAI